MLPPQPAATVTDQDDAIAPPTPSSPARLTSTPAAWTEADPPPTAPVGDESLQRRAMGGTLRAAPTALGAQFALLAGTSLALVPHAPGAGQLVWPGLMLLLLLARAGHLLWGRTKSPPAGQWMPQYLAGGSATALVWAALPWTMFDGADAGARVAGLLALVVGVGAEALALRAMSRIAIVQAALALLPATLWALVDGGAGSLAAALGLGVALSVQVAMAVSRDRSLHAVLQAEHEVQRLSRVEALHAERIVRMELEIGRAAGQLASLQSRADAEIRRLKAQLDLGQDQRAVDLERRSVELARQAITDPLTMLPNRKGINEHLIELLEPLLSDPEHRGELALLFLDLDKFKEVNDQHGHLAGDVVLKVVAERLREALPRSGFAARWGGDEFIVVLPGLGRIEQVRMVVDKLCAELAEPIRLEAGMVRVGCAVGIALAPYHGRTPEQLIINADHAVYAAKTEGGRDRVRVFDIALAKKAQRQHQIAQALPGALDNNQLAVVYQPIVDAATGNATHVEALARWPHSSWGPVSPGEFIPLAEQNGQIHKMGRWVLRQACLDAARWPGANPPKVSVNVSAIQVSGGHLVAQVREALAAAKLPPQRLVIELTESLQMAPNEGVASALSDLCAMGVTLALDDFGTGYSSLSALMKQPVNLVKIDQSFVRDLPGRRGQVMIKATVDVARNLGMQVVAEGVETAEQRAQLQVLGVQYMQGYLFGRPMPADEFRAWLALRDDGSEPFVLRA